MSAEFQGKVTGSLEFYNWPQLLRGWGVKYGEGLKTLPMGQELRSSQWVKS